MDTVISEKVKKIVECLSSNTYSEAQCKAQILEWGTPLIEEREGYSRFVWVTHFFFAGKEVENVVIYEPHITFNPERALMERFEGTSIFWKTTLVPYDFKLRYGFIVNDSLEPSCTARANSAILDPNNSEWTKEENGQMLSVIQIPIKEI